MKKKLLGLVLSLMALLCVFFITASAVESGDFIYQVEDGSAVIVGYTGKGGEVIIPSEIDGYQVSKIGSYAFNEIDTISKITISDGISYIDDYAFIRVSATNVIMSDSVVYIGEGAFSYCTFLKSITLSNKIEIIGKEAFSNTVALSTVVLPDTLTDLGERAFQYSAIKKINIPTSLKIIQNQTFSNTKLTDITIPENITSIGYGAFLACYKLKTVTFEGEIDAISNSTFESCNKLESINIPDSVTKIGDRAFLCCFALTEINFPSELKVIGNYAFDNCVSLTQLVFPDKVSKLGYRAFSTCRNLTFIDFNNVEQLGGEAFMSCHNLKQIIFGTKLTKVGKHAFTSELNQKSTVHICYKGTQTQWKEIEILKNNGVITNRPIHFNYTELHKTTPDIEAATLDIGGVIAEKCTICDYESVTEYIGKPYSFKLSKSAYNYDGKTKSPKVVVTDTSDYVLEEDVDYTLSYEKGRKLPGKYTVKITFKGKYSGVKRLYFIIKPASPSVIKASQTTTSITLKWSEVKGADGYRVYKYNPKTDKYEKLKDVVTTKIKVSELVAGTTYKFKIKAYTKDEGTIWGKSSAEFETATKPNTPKITKITSTAKGKATFTWSNVSGESGYQVYYSTKKDSGFKKVKSYKVNVLKGSKSALKSGKTYYFKVRAYKKTDSGTVFSAWSSVKKIKIK